MLHKRSFKPAKCKTALSLAKSRLKLMKNKKDVQLKHLRREVAQLLENGKDQTARVRVEHVIREEKTMAAYEMIEIYCELVIARLPIIESQKNCPLDLKEAVASLIFAAPRCGDIVELQDVRKHFTGKYGKEFVSGAVELRPDCGVSRSLVEKLSVKAPDGPTKMKFLTAIAEEHNIKWEPKSLFEDENPVPSFDIPKVAVAPNVESNKIQMQPFNFEIADDLEEEHNAVRPGTSSQSHTHTVSDKVPPSSTSHVDSRPSESSPEKMAYGQSSGPAENAFAAGRQNWNMEFKDATAAAHAAAESAELASRAARAAAEFSRRSNVMSDSPSVQGQSEDNTHSAGGVLQHSHVHRDSISGSFNQRRLRTQNQADSNRQGNIMEGADATGSNKDHPQFEVTRKQDFTESLNSRSQIRDSDLSPTTTNAELNVFRSSNFQDYEIESSENPFHEESVERKNHSSSIQSQSNDFGDEYGVFTNLNYDNYRNDPGDVSSDSLSRKTDDQEDWRVRSAYMYGEQDMSFKNHMVGNRNLESGEEHGFHSSSDIFVGMEHRTSGADKDEKVIRNNAEVYFDESDSDDEECVLNPAEERGSPSLGKSFRDDFSLNRDNPHYEPDLSQSFKRSSIYSKLIEPMPVTFDDSEGESSGSEKEQQKEKTDPGSSSYVHQKPDAEHHRDHMRSPYVEKGTADSFMSGKHDALQSSDDQMKSAALATDFRSRSDYGIDGPQESLRSLRLSESQHPVSEFEYETQLTHEGGMELNLGSLPGGRRNRTQLRVRGGVANSSSPSRSIAAATSDTFGLSENTSDFQLSSSRKNNKQMPTKMSQFQTHTDSSDDDTEVVIGSKRAEDSATIHGNVRKTSPNDPTGFFDSDDSSSEEDFPKPVVNKTFLGSGLSQRTKASAPRSVANSHTSAVTAKTGRSSNSYASEVFGSRVTSDEATYSQNSDSKASNDDKSLYSSVAEKPRAPINSDIPEASSNNERVPSRENSINKPSHVHPKLPDFETFTAHLQSLRKNRQ